MTAHYFIVYEDISTTPSMQNNPAYEKPLRLKINPAYESVPPPIQTGINYSDTQCKMQNVIII